MRQTIKYIFVTCIVILLLLPGIQHLFNVPIVNYSWLDGVTEGVNKPRFTFKSWLDESYQSQLTTYLSVKSGYKPLLVRLNNEILYRVFSETQNNVIVGKSSCLYLKEYIKAYTGKDLVEYGAVQERVKYAKQFQQIAESAGKQCLFIMAPGKASFNSEFIPDKYMRKRAATNNYQQLKKSFAENDLKYIDLYSYFLKQKPVSQYPLFSKYGTHWSIYGGGVALDSVIKYLRKNYSFPNYKIDSLEVTKTPRSTDRDLLDLLNIFSNPASPALAYPKFDRLDSNEVFNSPKILLIGDSYMWTFSNCGLMPLVAGKNVEYWYYGNTVFDYDAKNTGIDVKSLNLKEQFARFDVILFLYTESCESFFDFDKAKAFVQAIGPLSAGDTLKGRLKGNP